MPKVYLDVCCLNRPFDDQQQDRVHLESEAILLVLKRSAVVSYEVDNIPNQDRRNRIKALLKGATETLPLTNVAVERGLELKNLGWQTYDALHLACAEQAHVDVFLTTDDKVVKVAERNGSELRCQSKIL